MADQSPPVPIKAHLSQIQRIDKHVDHAAGLPTQLPSGRSRCYCGASIDIAGVPEHAQTPTAQKWMPDEIFR
jgi:hypothetical protein